jgi:hypothetical protein
VTQPKTVFKTRPLLNGFWFSLDGRQLRRATWAELKEAHRIWREYRWIRERAA